MELLDSKGRIFGKVNVVDFMAVVVVLVVLVLLLKLFILKGPETWVYAEVQLCEKNPNPLYVSLVKCGQSSRWASESVAKGDVGYGFSYLADSPIAEVLEVDSLAVPGDMYDVRVRVKLKVEVDKHGRIFFDNAEVKTGSNIKIELEKTTLIGVVTKYSSESLSGVAPVFVSKNVTVILYGVRPWFADSISVGDRDVDKKSGLLYATVTGKSVQPADMFTVTDAGEVLHEYNPLFNDLTLNLSIKARLEEDRLMYRGDEVKVGNKISVLTDKHTLSGSITGVW